MRRMNYNPFEKPFASGVFNQNRFVIDKPLELESIYFIMIYSEPDSSIAFLSTYSNNKTNNNFHSTAFQDVDLNDQYSLFWLDYALGKNKEINMGGLNGPSNFERTIYIYKIS